MAKIMMFFLSIFLWYFSYSQEQDDYYDTNSIMRYEDFTYKKNIHTVQLYKGDLQINRPIISLGSSDILTFRFDDLDGFMKNYYYTFVHCDVNWQPSDMMPMEFMTGVTNDYISHYKYSTNTFQKYINYSATFPNKSMNLTKSGNYILKVYEDGNEENIVFTKRFMVAESQITIVPFLRRASNVEFFSYNQEIDFNLVYDNYNLTNPYTDMTVVIQQNQRWDNCVKGIKPLFVKSGELVYDYDEENVFGGGNEYRYFDIKNLRYQTSNVKDILISKEKGNEVYLTDDKKRSYTVYSYWGDINGKRAINSEGSFDSNVDADYATVYFKFTNFNGASDEDGDLYVYGELTEWRFSDTNRMKYNKETGNYELSLFLKQGYYNYEYAFLPKGEKKADNSLTEGNHWQTENDYTIYVYHRQIGNRHDRLIAVKMFNSLKN